MSKRDILKFEGCAEAWGRALRDAGISLDDLSLVETHGFQVDVGRIRQPGDGIDLAVLQHRLSHRNADALDLHLGGVDAVGLCEYRPLRKCRVCRRRAENLAFEVFRLLDAAALAPDDGEGRFVVDHDRSRK